MTKDKKVTVSSDTTFEDVLRYDTEGALLVWDSEDFEPLSDEEVRQLRKANRDRYVIFKEIAEDLASADKKDKKVSEDFSVGASAGLAVRRLEIKGKDESLAYRWERPDMVEDRKDEGWKFVKDGVSTLRNQNGKGIHRIGAQGQEELVLMAIPKEKLASRKERKRLKRERAIEGIARESRNSIEKLGGIHVDDSTKAPFQPISHEEVRNG